MIRRIVRSLVPVAFVAAGTLGVLPATTAPATAAECAPGAGVSVVVDFGNLAGGVDQECGKAGVARSAVTSAGFSITGGEGGPDTVCQIDANEGAGPQPPAGQECWGRTQDHWWIFWSSQGAAWSSSTLGIDSLKLKVGDSVALVWQATTALRKPGAAPGPGAPVATKASTPPAPAGPVGPTAKSSKRPTTKHTQKPATHPASPSAAPTTSAAATTSSAAGSPSARTSASPTRTGPTRTGTASTSPAPLASTDSGSTASSESSSPVAATTDAPATSDGGGLPGWVAPVVVVAVLAAGGGIAVARRRRA